MDPVVACVAMQSHMQALLTIKSTDMFDHAAFNCSGKWLNIKFFLALSKNFVGSHLESEGNGDQPNVMCLLVIVSIGT